MRGDESLAKTEVAPAEAELSSSGAHALILLRWQWLAVAAIYGTAIALAYNALPARWLRSDDHLWLAMACGVGSLQLAIFWLALPLNRAPDAPGQTAAPLPWLGMANCLTLTRGMLVTLLAGFIFAPMPWGWMAWIPGILYGVERVVDLMDGYVARVTRRESRLGAILDMEFDGLGILIASAVAIQYGKIPAWYLLLGLGRPLFVAGIYLRQRLGWRVHPLAPSDLRRIVAGVQTVFVAVVLVPILPDALTWFAAFVFAVPLVASFVRDWLVVSDTLDAANATYLRLRARAKRVVEGWLPLCARIVAALLLGWLAFAATWGAGNGPTIWWLLLSTVLAAFALMLGIASRIAAALLILVLCADVALSGNSSYTALAPHTVLLTICGAIILHLGGGYLALWSPEERFVRTPLGA